MTEWEQAKFNLGCKLAQSKEAYEAYDKIKDLYQWQGDIITTIKHRGIEKMIAVNIGQLRWALGYIKMTKDFVCPTEEQVLIP